MTRVRIRKTHLSLTLAIGWGTFAVVSMFLPSVRSSLPLIYFMSAYALAATHLSEWAGHKAEVAGISDEDIDRIAERVMARMKGPW